MVYSLYVTFPLQSTNCCLRVKGKGAKSSKNGRETVRIGLPRVNFITVFSVFSSTKMGA